MNAVVLKILVLVSLEALCFSFVLPEAYEMFEGDVILNEKQNSASREYKSFKNGMKKPARDAATRRWPGRTMLYKFATGHFKSWQKRIVLDSMQDLERNSCVRFRQASDKNLNHIIFVKTGGDCASTVGYSGKRRPTPLHLGSPECLTKGSVQHELLHSLGMWHEHTRPDRDSFITVLWNNIQREKWYNFRKQNPGAEVLKLPYDYDSVLHYRRNAFSKDKVTPTILPRFEDRASGMGQRVRASRLDIAKLNAFYSCDNVKKEVTAQ